MGCETRRPLRLRWPSLHAMGCILAACWIRSRRSLDRSGLVGLSPSGAISMRSPSLQPGALDCLILCAASVSVGLLAVTIK